MKDQAAVIASKPTSHEEMFDDEDYIDEFHDTEKE